MRKEHQTVIDTMKHLLLQDTGPEVTCESCGKKISTTTLADNTRVVVFVNSPMHPDISSYNCPLEHWNCGEWDCVVKTVNKCLNEHMKQLHMAIQEKLSGNISTDISDTLPTTNRKLYTKHTKPAS